MKNYIINKSGNTSYVIYHCEGHTTKTVFKSDFVFIMFIAKLEFEVTSCIILPSNKFKASNLVPEIIYGTDLFARFMYVPERTIYLH